jgi:hypothetical protein
MSGPGAATDIVDPMSIDESGTCTTAAGHRVAALARETYAAAAVQRIAALPAKQVQRLAAARAHVAAETVRYLSYTATCY